MAAHQAPPSLGFSRQEHWSGPPFPSPMCESEKWKWSRSVMSDSLWPHGLQPTRLLCPWDFPGKSAGVGCHCLLQGYLEYNVKYGTLLKWMRGTLEKVLNCLRKSQNFGEETVNRHLCLEDTRSEDSEGSKVPGSSPGWSRVFEGETARRPIQMLIRYNKEE